MRLDRAMIDRQAELDQRVLEMISRHWQAERVVHNKAQAPKSHGGVSKRTSRKGEGGSKCL